MTIFHCALLACLLGVCLAGDWQTGRKVNLDDSHSIMLGLRQNNFDATCPTLLDAVSNPKSPKYTQYLTFQEIGKLTYDAEAIHMVTQFLVSEGVDPSDITLNPNGEILRFTTSFRKLESMFKANFYEFSSVKLGRTTMRSKIHAVPAAIQPYVKFISGISDFSSHTRRAKVHAMTARQTGGVTPQLIWQTYSMPNESDATPKADQSVFEALGQSFSPSDLQQFQQQFNLPEQAVKQIIGPNDPTQCTSNPDNCAEANLDVQYIMAMAQGAPTIYWSIPTNDSNIFLDWIDAVAKDPTPPQVFSVSYGGPEGDEDPTVVTAFNTEVCKMGLRGITVFVASGDDGVAGAAARNDASQCGMNPDYPAGCPYVTAVGATMGPELGKPEEACCSNAGSIITTGGGFSNVFSRPSWQDTAVSQYLKTAPDLPPPSTFNTNGRGYPDVGALGNDYNVIIGGQAYQVSGTSASSPVFCGMVTLANGLREAKGKNPLGFLNPLLYSMDTSVFNDITKGRNNCCATAAVCCQYGFNATKGWDPLTGWGSIDFKRFVDAVIDL